MYQHRAQWMNYEDRALLYPQPAHDQLHVQHADLHGSVSIRLMALDGRTVLNGPCKLMLRPSTGTPYAYRKWNLVLLLGSATSKSGLRC